MNGRVAYTRKELARILGVTDRTLVRWHTEGKHFHPWQDPDDPFKRWWYDAAEVEAYRRKHRRGSGSYRIDSPGRGIPARPWAAEPAVPGPVAARIYARLGQGDPLDEICKEESVAPEQIIHLEQLRRRFEEERERPARKPSPSQPRIVSDESDPEIASVAKELAEERSAAARAPSHVEQTEVDDEQPPSRGKRSR
jgi:hypothetical protein